jgi:hypothetical protein
MRSWPLVPQKRRRHVGRRSQDSNEPPRELRREIDAKPPNAVQQSGHGWGSAFPEAAAARRLPDAAHAFVPAMPVGSENPAKRAHPSDERPASGRLSWPPPVADPPYRPGNCFDAANLPAEAGRPVRSARLLQRQA